MMSSGIVVLSFLLLHTGAQGFGILPGKSLNHLEITEQAILNTAVDVCRALAQTEGTLFTSPSAPFTVENVAAACGAPKSSRTFRLAIIVITLMNTRVDLRHALNGSFHFDEEMIVQGRNIITEGIKVVKASNKQNNFEAAREKLGEIFHPLQDFYSHSNWVELGSQRPNPNLIRSDTSIGNIADESRATCRNCDGDDCRNNILEDIIEEKVLTTGYFGVVPFVSTKPAGKCSHGGAVDQTSGIEPKGGINKDTFESSHGHLHMAAADMAIAATMELLQNIREDAGDRPFLQMIGITKGSSKALCFVIDTTASMSDDIEVVKNVTSFIINSEVGTDNEPSVYILVPFNDPDVGPQIKTTDPEIFKSVINGLFASGGGDEPEMSLSGLQLALTSAPLNSEIFLFTDAPAKDKQLKSTLIALIERTQTVVNFLISSSTAINRRKRRGVKLQQHQRITEEDAELYKVLAQTSGGVVIEVAKDELPVAVSIITESSISSLVTLLLAARSPGRSDSFSFMVDESVTNPRIYITGRSVTFTLTSPTGESQQSTDTSGSLITSSQLVGNFLTVRIANHSGQWGINMVSTNPYTLKVIGQSDIDFLFQFVEMSQGPFAGFDVLDSRPRAGVNGSLLVTLTGDDLSNVTEVALVELSGPREVAGVVEPQESSTYLVTVDRMPSFDFVVRVKGQNGATPPRVFQRQTSTNFRTSNLTISADSNGNVEPGTPFIVSFSVMSDEIRGNLTIRATNNRPTIASTFPTSLSLDSGNSANGTVTLLAPRNTPSGTDITLTIEAEAPGAEDTNYVVLRLSVISSVTDFTPPVCALLNLQSNCSENCSLSTWELSAQVTDGAEGTGVSNVSLKLGNGTMNTSLAAGNENITLVSYRASCCSPDMELMVMDQVGNIGRCAFTIRESSQGAFSFSTKVMHSTFLSLITVALGLHMTEVGL